MNKKYCVRFFTRDYDNDGQCYDDHELARYMSNSPIPIPRIDEIVLLEDDTANIYRVVGVENVYPYTEVEPESYEFESDIIVEITD